MEVYQFDQDTGIAVNMMNDDAIKSELNKAKGIEEQPKQQLLSNGNGTTRNDRETLAGIASVVTSFKSDSQSLL